MAKNRLKIHIISDYSDPHLSDVLMVFRSILTPLISIVQ